VRETALQTPRSVNKGGGGGAQDAAAESFPLQLMVKTMVRQVALLQSMGGTQWSRYPPAPRGRDHTPEQVDA